MKKGIILTIISCLLALLLMGCGGDTTDSSKPSTESTPTTDSSAPTTDSSAPTTDSSVPSTDSSVPSTDSSAPSTDSSVPSTDSSVPSTDSSEPSTDSSTPDPKPELKDFEGITFSDLTVDYNGQEQEIRVTGELPLDASVSYTNNKGTNAGTYKATAVISMEGYNTLTLNATLKINKIALDAIVFENGSFEYDEKEHAISVTGNIPSGVSVSYTGGENGKNGATNVGSYEITATVMGDNYITLVLKATLTVRSTAEKLTVFVHNGLTYFQNALDHNYLYVYNGSTITRVSRDMPTNMVSAGEDLFYISSSLLSSCISMIDSEGKITDLFDVSAEMLATDGTYLYYNISGLLSGEKNGIYKIKIADLKSDSAEPVATKLTSAKSDFIVYAQGHIYFSNKSEGSKLYAISTSANNSEPTLIYNYKVSDIITDGNTVFFTRDITLSNLSAGAAIFSIDVRNGLCALVDDDSDKVTKITVSKGKYLTLLDGDIYFANTDMLVSTIFGDGIYKASADGNGWVNDTISLLTGAQKVIDGECDNVYSLSSDGEYLYYYRASTKHLYRYNISTGAESDLMQGFTPPVEKEVLATYYEKAVMYNGEIYFINMRDGGKLYKYSPQAQSEYRITGAQVADFAIYNDCIYYTTVKFLVNFDLYRMSLINGEPELISNKKCMNLSFVQDKIYYTNYSSNNTFNSMNLDGTEDTVLYGDKEKDEESVSAGETVVYDGFVYFVANEQLYRYELATGTSSLVNKKLNPLEYLIYDGKILLMNCNGFQNHIDIYDIENDEITEIAKLGISGISDDARGMFVYNGEFYFYRNVTAGSSNAGLYKVVDGEAVLVDELEGYYLCESMVDGDTLYFLDVWQIKDSFPTTSSDGCLYKLNLKTLEITKLN